MIEEAKSFFLTRVENYGSDPLNLLKHLPGVDKWGAYILKLNPEADREVAMTGIWLHDVGHYSGLKEKVKDHAVRGEIEARQFLIAIGCTNEKVENIAHCVRAHRCKDVLPQTIEAKIVAAADSASHMTDGVYVKMIIEGMDLVDVYAKMERDFRDLGYFPELRSKMIPLYGSWKSLISNLHKTNLMLK